MRVEIYDSGIYRAHVIAGALAQGFANLSRDRHIDWGVIQSRYWRDEPRADVMIMYGLPPQNRPIWEAHRAAGKTCVLIDMGYFGRLEGGRYSGYHRFSVNAWHPERYIMKWTVDGKRWQKFRRTIRFNERWGSRSGKHILIAGMQGKTYELWGMEPEAWEQNMVRRLQKITDMPILYRPKPSWKGSKGIYGARLYSGEKSLDDILGAARFVVSHHSNMGIEAVAFGVPFYQEAGAATPLSTNLNDIENPPERTVEQRLDLLHRVAYAQYNVAEMQSGHAWRTLEEIGAVPCL